MHGTAEGAIDWKTSRAFTRRATIDSREVSGYLRLEHDARAIPLGQDLDRAGHFQPPFLGHLHPPPTTLKHTRS